MYYNIKIKSKDSEFTLDSNNKAVIQREMDIYFAHIFNASEEFKSKIKKVEITNENVKSIIEVEEPQSKPIEAKEAPVNNLQEIKFSNTQENHLPISFDNLILLIHSVNLEHIQLLNNILDILM